MIVSATELYVKNIFKLWPALKISGTIIREIQRSPGMLHVKAGPKRLLLLTTITAWETEEAMMQFVRSGTHLEAMKRTKEFASAARVTHWETDELPTKEEVRQRLEAAKMMRYQ